MSTPNLRESIDSLTLSQFRRLGIAFCYRLRCDQKDKRLGKALRRLERSLGPPPNDQLRRDALNAASSIYRDLAQTNHVLRAAACTLVCACWDEHTPNLIGNFYAALREAECLSSEEIDATLKQMINAVIDV
ncbi:hypothetical protein VN12_20000 [Pirellula sp. SH-Sr6A]|uniref:hypothetical protein n=1 Tax=Pirellula sp. SH-Sr6A TaxID=1632865 RepID=UPI00078EC761|nr:hypothetical protein [Pirellula sp. SH-Sr6A]AMV34418.1 hypothetical protein VN12_20000 [Pirellula sp. SH-Sr6A]